MTEKHAIQPVGSHRRKDVLPLQELTHTVSSNYYTKPDAVGTRHRYKEASPKVPPIAREALLYPSSP